jgi:hypothetical protein
MNLLSLAAIDNRPLASLARTGLEKMFHSWIGASGRRYVCSVYSLSEPPAFDYRRAIVAAIRRTRTGAAIAFVFEPHESDDFNLWARRARAAGAEEWHVHLLADTPDARAFVVRDLCPARRVVA